MSKDDERRKEARFSTLGTRTPRCPCCGETSWVCFELHHVSQRLFDRRFTIPICANCHRKLSEMQKDHPMFDNSADPFLQNLVHFLLGLADMLELIVEKLREFASPLMDRARDVAQPASQEG